MKKFVILPLTAGLFACACGGDEDGGSELPGTGGTTGGSSTGGYGGFIPGTGGTVTGGETAAGGSSGSGGAGTGGDPASGGSSGATTGGSGGGEEVCTPPSLDGFPYAGSCAGTDHCNDQYDTTFGAATLQQMCEAQDGAWSTTPCNAAGWNKLCWQELMGGIYVQYLPADGICAFGCEEPL